VVLWVVSSVTYLHILSFSSKNATEQWSERSADILVRNPVCSLQKRSAFQWMCAAIRAQFNGRTTPATALTPNHALGPAYGFAER
jgi:hypothetical protein